MKKYYRISILLFLVVLCSILFLIGPKSHHLLVRRQFHRSILLKNGEVLVVGGREENPLAMDLTNLRIFLGLSFFTDHASCELFAPETQSFRFTGSLKYPIQRPRLHLLPNGRVVAIDAESLYTPIEIYDPVSGSWSTPSGRPPKVFGYSSVMLANGKILTFGGALDKTWTKSVSDCNIFDPANGSWTHTANMLSDRANGSPTLLANGQVLVIGGATVDSDGSMSLNTCELYDPKIQKWSNAGVLVERSSQNNSQVLNDGTIFFVTSYFCELYNPITGIWKQTETLIDGLDCDSTITLKDGRVLAIGSNCEIYEPKTGKWRSTGSMMRRRAGFSATLLGNGKVLVTGGGGGNDPENSASASCELYDPGTETWTML